jgi:hypothetical protein
MSTSNLGGVRSGRQAAAALADRRGMSGRRGGYGQADNGSERTNATAETHGETLLRNAPMSGVLWSPAEQLLSSGGLPGGAIYVMGPRYGARAVA